MLRDRGGESVRDDGAGMTGGDVGEAARPGLENSGQRRLAHMPRAFEIDGEAAAPLRLCCL